MSTERATILQEIIWRLRCRQDLVEYAKTIPIPGVPQGDNIEELIEAGLWGHTIDQDTGRRIDKVDGRYDGQDLIPTITTHQAPHHVLILETLQHLVEDGLIAPDGEICKRVLLLFPPGSAKSTYASVVFPTWVMGREPEFPVILTGYADMICKKHGKRARQICQSQEYKSIFETTISKDTKAADLWQLENGSEYLSSGLQSGLTGNRCGGLIWDDPVKGRRAAESRTEQLATWDAYKDDARTRKIPTAWEVGIQTRWAEGDLAGRVLPRGWAGESGYMQGSDGNLWYVLCVPAEAEHDDDPLGRKPGEYLWSEWFPESSWQPFKIDQRSWGSLYQQVPTPPEGDYFLAEWVQYYDKPPRDEDLVHYVSGDYAVTDERDADDPDWSDIGVWGVDADKNIYYRAGWHGRETADKWIEHALDLGDRHQAVAHISGAGVIRRGIEPFFKAAMRKVGIFLRLVWYSETHSKEVNARSFQAMMSNGQVYWPRNDSEAERVIRHLLGFGTMTHDDPVDMCSFLGRHLAKLWGKKKKREAKPPPVITPEIKIKDIMPPRKMKKRSW